MNSEKIIDFKGINQSSNIAEIYSYDRSSILKLPLYLEKISAGFPSPADDYIDKKLDLNDLLIDHPSSTFFVRVSGDSMLDIGINDEDILVVDRSLQPTSGKIIIAILDGELTVKKLQIIKGKYYLVAENKNYKPIEIKPEMDFEVWGVVTSVIHKL